MQNNSKRNNSYKNFYSPPDSSDTPSSMSEQKQSKKISDFFSKEPTNKPESVIVQPKQYFNESMDLNHPIYDILLHKEIARLEQIFNSLGFDEENLKEKEEKSNEVKSDNKNNFSNSEEEIPDESNDNEYRCGRYNGYGKSDR
ncbi:793_t:CDS:2, partial [Gigaspora margarita]